MTPDQFRQIIREELDTALDPIKEVLLMICDRMPGSMPGHRSHLRRDAENVLGR